MQSAVKQLGILAIVGSGLYIAPFLPNFNVCAKSLSLRIGPKHDAEFSSGRNTNPPRTLQTLRQNDVTGRTNTFSIVIPAYNEGKENMLATLKSLSGSLSKDNSVQVVVVDGGCKDDTMEAIQECSFGNLMIQTVKSAGVGRGPALNTGASVATGNILLFLHADTTLPRNFDEVVSEALANEDTLMTAFTFGIRRQQDMTSSILEASFKFVESGADRRSRFLWLPYGDQAFALRREVFDESGSFPDFKMMEDFEFVSRLRDRALITGKRIQILPEVAFCSSRRWQVNGVFKNTILNWLFVAAYTCAGKTPDWIFQHYYG